jgi:hypothetical protein
MVALNAMRDVVTLLGLEPPTALHVSARTVWTTMSDDQLAAQIHQYEQLLRRATGETAPTQPPTPASLEAETPTHEPE